MWGHSIRDGRWVRGWLQFVEVCVLCLWEEDQKRLELGQVRTYVR